MCVCVCLYKGMCFMYVCMHVKKTTINGKKTTIFSPVLQSYYIYFMLQIPFYNELLLDSQNRSSSHVLSNFITKHFQLSPAIPTRYYILDLPHNTPISHLYWNESPYEHNIVLHATSMLSIFLPPFYIYPFRIAFILHY